MRPGSAAAAQNAMKRKNVISQVTLEQSSPEVLKARADHEAAGYWMTNMKETLMHNLVAFDALENGFYAVNRELAKHIPARSLTFFCYAVSTGTDCLICGHYFKKLVADMGVDFDTFAFTDEENDLIAFARALASDPNYVPDDVYEALQARYDEETMVLLVTFGVLMLANNYYNNIIGTKLDAHLYPYYDGDPVAEGI